MKTLYNFFVLLSVLIGTYSCTTTKEEKFIKEAEHYFEEEVLPKFNDPKSYEKVSSVITDTAFKYEIIQEEIQSELITIELYQDFYNDSKGYVNQGYEVFQSVADNEKLVLDNATKKEDSLKSVLKNIRKDEISYIDITHTFRANIPLGGLMLGNYTIRYHVVGDDGYFEIINEKGVSF
jgi:hypothetical protein